MTNAYYVSYYDQIVMCESSVRVLFLGRTEAYHIPKFSSVVAKFNSLFSSLHILAAKQFLDHAVWKRGKDYVGGHWLLIFRLLPRISRHDVDGWVSNPIRLQILISTGRQRPINERLPKRPLVSTSMASSIRARLGIGLNTILAFRSISSHRLSADLIPRLTGSEFVTECRGDRAQRTIRKECPDPVPIDRLSRSRARLLQQLQLFS